MIRIKEIFPDKHSIEVKVDGILDRDSLSVFEEICRRHLRENRRIWLNFEGLIHISREAREFLREIQDRIIGIRVPPAMEWEGIVSPMKDPHL